MKTKIRKDSNEKPTQMLCLSNGNHKQHGTSRRSGGTGPIDRVGLGISSERGYKARPIKLVRGSAVQMR